MLVKTKEMSNGRISYTLNMGDDVPEILPVEQWQKDYTRLAGIPFIGSTLGFLSVILKCVKMVKKHYAEND